MSYTKKMITEMEQKAESVAPLNKALLQKLKKQKPKNLDKVVHEFHYEVFEKIDCLECGNCCKSLGPMLSESDITRLASADKSKVSNFKDQHIRIDEDGDYVFKNMPCPFLGHDHYCFYYQNRPKACREYPHTDRKRFYQVAMKTYHNSFSCPAVYLVLEKLRTVF